MADNEKNVSNGFSEEKYVTVEKSASAQLEMKKSVFTASVAHVSSEEEAAEFINRMKKENREARHNVWAYLLRGGVVARMSDDGEPQGTGGVPVLDTIKKFGVEDVAVVVTRYFGGILLGAGGLVRCYSGAAKEALLAAGRAEYVPYTEFSVSVSYSDHRRIQSELSKYGMICDGADFGSDVFLKLAVKECDFERCEKYFRELGSGKYTCRILGQRLGKV